MDRVVPPSDITPHEFFTRWVPQSVIDDDARRTSLSGTVAVLEFALDGADGGTFHLAVADGRVEGRPGPANGSGADLRIRLDVETWRALNAGALSAPEAFLTRRVKLDGNLGLALKLHLILG